MVGGETEASSPGGGEEEGWTAGPMESAERCGGEEMEGVGEGKEMDEEADEEAAEEDAETEEEEEEAEEEVVVWRCEEEGASCKLSVMIEREHSTAQQATRKRKEGAE